MNFKAIVTGWAWLTGITCLAQAIDNPYKTHYQSTCHWTDDLPWNQVFTISQFPGSDWNQKLDNAQAAAVQAGGGVVYFPAGEYQFSNSIIIRNEVILRGETPANADATQEDFSPPSRLVFPSFTPVFTGTGGDNSSSFRSIRSEYSGSNTGLVYLDIDHATLAFQPQFFKQPGSHGDWTLVQLNEKRNVIVFGVRNNHATYPNSWIVPKPYQQPWQRWAWHYASNVDAFVNENLVICNNRFNDYTNNTVHPIADQSYGQPGFVAFHPDSNNNISVTDGSRSIFNYNDHYGITVNRFKANFDYVNGEITGAFADLIIQNDLAASPLTNTSLFPKGVEINDNWVYNTLSCAMFIAGQGMEVKRNVIRGKNDKVRWINRSGTWYSLPNAFLENRGLDLSGWDLKVEDNDIQVFNHRIANTPYRSNDGEGILMQECCGGSLPVNITISNNNILGTNAMLGLYKTRDMQNVLIQGNNLNGNALFVDANTNDKNYSLYNVTIRNNKEVGGLTCTGSNGGNQVRVYRNQGSGDFRKNCYVLDSNNNGFAASVCLPFMETPEPDTFHFSFTPGDTIHFPNPSYPAYVCRTQNPASLIRFAVQDSVIYVPDTASFLSLPFLVSSGSMDSVAVVANIRRVAWANLTSGVATFPVPTGCRNTVTLYGYDPCGRIMISPSILIIRIPSNSTRFSDFRNADRGFIRVFPNPARDRVQIELPEKRRKEIEIQDALGKTWSRMESDHEGKINFPLNHLPAGIYHIRSGNYSTNFIKNQ